MKIWIVGVSDCEGNSIRCVCATKKIAERELFKARDELVAEWKEMDEYSQKSIKEFCEKENKPIWVEDMYSKMIEALSGNDYEKWDNDPHDRPYLYEMEVIQ
jgi:hypothetical protein